MCLLVYSFISSRGFMLHVAKKQTIGTVSYFRCVIFWFTPEKDKNGFMINHIDKGKLMEMTF